MEFSDDDAADFCRLGVSGYTGRHDPDDSGVWPTAKNERDKLPKVERDRDKLPKVERDRDKLPKVERDVAIVFS